DHDINYYVRTIAHNTLVVYNPAEDFSSARPDAYSNDGGQRTMTPASRSPENIEYFDQHAVHYDTGDILRFQDDAGYTYVLGDAAKAYNNPTYNQAMDTGLDGNTAKVSRFQREFVYLRPPTAADGPPGDEFVVLYDRVGVTDPALSGENTKLLFHTLNQPTVNGAVTVVSPGETLYAGASEASAISGDGRVFLRFLLPATRNVRRVGGRGEKAFWVFNDNYDWQWDPGEAQPRPTNDFEDVPYGEWRLELEPADAALEHGFLTVIYPAVSTTFATHSVLRMPATTLITGAGLAGAHIADPALNRVVLFSSASDGSAPPGALVYAYQPTTSTLNLLVDLTPGARYALTTTTAGGVQTVTWTPDSGGAYQASDQGALSMVLDVGGAPLDQHRLYLPLVLRGLAVDVVAAPATGEMIPRAYLPLVSKPLAFAGVNDFLYQLQNLNLTAIGNTAYDLVVMDYSADGSAGGEFSAAQIAALKHSPGGDKIVLAYMSIGEAEDYRFYWQSGWTPGDPAWLDVQNPDWPGNYKVRYWDPGWQAIVFSYTDRLLDAGFDGAYLDIIDAYEYYADRGRATAAQEMADFVAAIRAYARARDPDFLIVPQNAPELAGLVPAYLHSVDGIGQEDIYYGYNADNQPTPPAVTAEMEGYLDVFKAAGKLVLTVDYATTPAHVDDAYAKSQAKGYVPFVTVRDLDQLTINPGHEPD
ncbi:MAG: endo alpha-1,4 polygalactosaminidase, partial [Chloroflexi bacterium]|nr:endo alpha-1,4 polygalactosaminidase [Chloroflexota bacterium]